MVAFDNSIFCLALHPDARPRSTVDRAKERVDYLLERLAASNERVILPAPAFAEFLILAGTDAPKYLSVIRDNAIFRIEPFDERASIELADIEISARLAGNKRGSATDSEWQKVKFDRQIVAIAKAHECKTIYSDDPHIKKHGEDCGIEVLQLADLPVRPATQIDLFKPEDKDGKAETLSSADPTPGSPAGPAPSHTGAEAEAKRVEAAEGEVKTESPASD